MPSASSIRSWMTTCVKIVGVEAGGKGLARRRALPPRSPPARPGVLHGNRTYLLQDGDGQIKEGHSISAGLDYPGIGPEHSWLHDIGRVEYVPITDDEALEAFQLLTPHSRASFRRSNRATRWPKSSSARRRWARTRSILMNLSGRGDKDIFTVGKITGYGAVRA